MWYDNRPTGSVTWHELMRKLIGVSNIEQNYSIYEDIKAAVSSTCVISFQIFQVYGQFEETRDSTQEKVEISGWNIAHPINDSRA